MDTNLLVSKLKEHLPGRILETSFFGRVETLCLWVESKAIAEVAEFLLSTEDLAYDEIESLSCMQLEDALVLSYFLRSTQTKKEVVLRVSLAITSPKNEIDMPSVQSLFPAAIVYEQEIHRLFGVRFLKKGRNHADARVVFLDGILPPGRVGFPLRKSFEVFVPPVETGNGKKNDH